MPAEKVIELSVEETNRLRAELGLAPLRDGNTTTAAATPAAEGDGEKKELLELSVQDTNDLRARLGLKPLTTAASSSAAAPTSNKIQHAPAVNLGDTKAAAERIEQAKLKRQVERKLQENFATQSLGEQQPEGSSAASWAQQMRKAEKQSSKTAKTKGKKPQEYGERDLQGLSVGHALTELEAGSETVLTLQDAPLLQTDETSQKVLGLHEGGQEELQNVDLAAAQQQQHGLAEKRKVELGRGRAGGYAGFDDDEFEELGGTQAPSRFGREDAKKQKKKRGFQIGAVLEEQEEESDLFTSKAISLEPAQADVAASDFMSAEEYEALRPKKKEAKFKKKKKEKKSKKKKSRTRTEESDEEDDDVVTADATNNTNAPSKGSLLDDLEETAVDTAKVSRKRRRSDDADNQTSNDGVDEDRMDIDAGAASAKKKTDSKQSKYEQVMAKGNERSFQAFSAPPKKVVAAEDEEPDDAFLNAALSKARRLNRLKDMKKKRQGADAMVAAAVVQQDMTANNSSSNTGTSTTTGTIQFSVDETREFTIALKAKTEQAEREQVRKAAVAAKKKEDIAGEAATTSKNVKMEVEETKTLPEAPTATKEEEEKVEAMEEDVDIHELAKQVKEDDAGLDGTTGKTVSIGRGVGNLLNLLKQTGEMTRKNAGKEEMRGRAKDKRTYEDYQPLDLSKVVRIDERYANEKDRELAHREIKLEYRDKHGRLLTRKEAFRDMSHQFHGYGSGKRKEEKKLEQIAREQAEARLASKQAAGAGTLGALKATQKATGKAFVVHKTGN